MKEYCIHWIDEHGETFFGWYKDYEFAKKLMQDRIAFNQRNHICEREIYIAERDVSEWRKCETEGGR